MMAMRMRPFVHASVVAVSLDRKSTRLNSSHVEISYAVFCLKKKKIPDNKNHGTVQWNQYLVEGLFWEAIENGRPYSLSRQQRSSPTLDIFFFLRIRRPPTSTLFPSRPFFR